MNNNKTSSFPVENEIVTAVIVSDKNIEVCNAKVILSKGKGIVLEQIQSDYKITEVLKTGAKARLFYSVDNENYVVKGKIEEIIDKKKFYITPTSKVEKGEKREFIRANLTLPVFISTCEVKEGAGVPLSSREVNISGSGFKLPHNEKIEKDEEFYIILQLPFYKENIKIKAVVIRCEKKEGEFEIAGKFINPPTAYQEAIIKEVFKKRYEELGIEEEE